MAHLCRGWNSFHILNQVMDKRVWRWDPEGIYTVKSAFKAIASRGSEDFPRENMLVWKCKSPMKYKFLSWLVWSGKVNVNEMLQKRYPNLAIQPSMCGLYKADNETLDHVFLHCNFSHRLWGALLKDLSASWVMPSRVKDVFSQQAMGRVDTKRESIWATGLQAILWWIWAERNGRLFEERARDWSEVWDSIKRAVASALVDTKDFRSWGWNTLNEDWTRIL